MWRGDLSYRRLWALVENLPQDSATQTALRDEPRPEPVEQSDGPSKFGPWSLTDYLLARLVDAVNENTYVAKVAGRLTPVDPPRPIPRPGMDRRPVAVAGRPSSQLAEAQVLYLDKIRAKG